MCWWNVLVVGRFIAYVDVQMSPWVTWDMSLGGVFVGMFGGKKGENAKTSWEKETLQEGSHTVSKSVWFVYCIPCFCSSFWLEKIALQLQNNENVVWFFVIKRWEFVDICTPWAVKERQRWFGRLTSHPNGYFGERETCFCFKNQPKILQNKKSRRKETKQFPWTTSSCFFTNLETLQRKKTKNSFPEKKLDFKKTTPRWGDFVSVCLSFQLENGHQRIFRRVNVRS